MTIKGSGTARCPECGRTKPNHQARCRFGAALAQGRAAAAREAMPPQMRALRDVVAAQVHQPLALTGAGLADLVDRVTRAVAPGLREFPGPRCPECGEPYRTVLVGTPDEGRSCTHRSGCTWVWTRSPESQQQFPQEYLAGPEATPEPVPSRYGECPQTERHAAHQWTGGLADEVRYWCDGEPSAGGTVDGARPHRPVAERQDAAMDRAAEQWEQQNPVTPERAAAMLAGRTTPTSCLLCGQPWIDAAVRHLPGCPEGLRLERSTAVEGCPGCGEIPVRTALGRYTRHLASCTGPAPAPSPEG